MSSCVTISELISSGRDLLQKSISSPSLRRGVPSCTQDPKNIHGGQWNAWRSSRRRVTGEGVDSCSASAAWSASELMARLMVLAMEASVGDVEDTQRRDFSNEALSA